MISKLSSLDQRIPLDKEETTEKKRSSTLVSAARDAISGSGRSVASVRSDTNQRTEEFLASRVMRTRGSLVLTPIRPNAAIRAAFYISQPTDREERTLRRAHENMIKGCFLIKKPLDLHLWIRDEVGKERVDPGLIHRLIVVVGQFDLIRKKILMIERCEKLSNHELEILNAFKCFVKYKTIDPKNKLDVYLWMTKRSVFAGLIEEEFIRTFAHLWLISDTYCFTKIRLRLQKEVEKGSYSIDDELRLGDLASKGLRYYDCHSMTSERFIRLKKYIPELNPKDIISSRSGDISGVAPTVSPTFVVKFEAVRDSSTRVKGRAAADQDEFLLKLNSKLESLRPH